MAMKLSEDVYNTQEAGLLLLFWWVVWQKPCRKSNEAKLNVRSWRFWTERNSNLLQKIQHCFRILKLQVSLQFLFVLCTFWRGLFYFFESFFGSLETLECDCPSRIKNGFGVEVNICPTEIPFYSQIHTLIYLCADITDSVLLIF